MQKISGDFRFFLHSNSEKSAFGSEDMKLGQSQNFIAFGSDAQCGVVVFDGLFQVFVAIACGGTNLAKVSNLRKV